MGIPNTFNVKVKFAKIKRITSRQKPGITLYWPRSAKAWVSNGICYPSSPRPDRWESDYVRGVSALVLLNLPLTLKFPTWQVMLQSRKSKELTVNFCSCGSYDLIRYYALNLTSSRSFPYARTPRRNRCALDFWPSISLGSSRWRMAVVNSCFDVSG